MNVRTLIFKTVWKKRFLILGLIISQSVLLNAQELPLGYKLYYNHSANKVDLFQDLVPDDSASWMIVTEKPVNLLRISTPDSLSGKYPQSRAMLNKWIWGDFILKFDYKYITKNQSDSSGFSLIAPARSPEFYYAYTIVQDTIKFYVVDRDVPDFIGSTVIPGIQEGWNSVLVTRDILSRALIFQFNGSEDEIKFSHPDLVMGYLGFGTHQGTSYIKNILIWAPTQIEEKPFVW